MPDLARSEDEARFPFSFRNSVAGRPLAASSARSIGNAAPKRRALQIAMLGLILLCPLLLGGCATAPLAAARVNFYRGNFERADQALTQTPGGETDKVLILMERGMARQARGLYEASTKDWQEAADLAEKLDYYSLTRGTASYAVNDRLMAFRGAPYERTLMHAFAANSYMAMSLWDDAAVEARNIIARLENRYGFPDDAYSRYLAGFCLEMAGDSEGAAFQYRFLSNMLTNLTVNERSGRIAIARTNAWTGTTVWSSDTPKKDSSELVCFVSIGRSPDEGQGWTESAAVQAAPFAEFYDNNDTYLGRTYPLANTGRLMADTQKRLAALKLLKTSARVAAKEAVSSAVSQKNELLGEILRLILFAMEAPDTRRWESLPAWLEVGRMTCPEGLKSFKVVFKDSSGRTLGQKAVNEPISRHGKTYVSFCRDL